MKNKADDNANDIATNKSDIATNKSDIAANKSDIATNKSDIATNKSDIATNKSDIATNKSDIATNKSDIATNKTNIATNTSKITDLEDLADTLGLDKATPGVKYFRANSTEPDASATGTDAVAIGPSALASGENALAAGTSSDARGDRSVASGYNARTSVAADNSVAVGNNAVSGAAAGMLPDEGSSAIVYGGGRNSVAVGNYAQARGNSSIALGDGAVVMNNGRDGVLNSGSMAIGTGARTVDSNAVAIGTGARVTLGGNGAVALGQQAVASAEKTLAIGSEAVARSRTALAAGASAQATGVDTVAVGRSAAASGESAIAVGKETVASGYQAVSIGAEASAAAKDSVALGTRAGVGMTGDVAGTKGSHVVIGNEAGQNVDGSQDIAIGYKSGSNVKSDYNIAIGSEAGTNIGTSVGQSAVGKNVSIGYNANKYDTATAVMQSTAIGGETRAADDAVALGWNARATGNGAVAAGFNAVAADSASLALGQSAQAYGGNIAIGNGSVADSTLISGTGYLTGQAAPSTVVSVGNTNTLRRLVNVADGAQDQDAVTVAQLRRSIDETVSKVNSSISTATNSDVKYDVVASGSGDSITLRNNNGANTLIHNVAEGTLDTDAVNVGQLNSSIDAAKTHYYSVNSVSANNYNNDGATGTDALAAGVTVKALGDRSVAAGNNTEAQGGGSIALGAGYDPDNTGNMIQTVTVSGYEYNLAIGAGAQSAGNSSLAIGTRAVTALKDGAASVDQAVSIGYFSTASADKSIALGSEAKSNSGSATAIGDSAQALAENALAQGTNAKATGVSSGAIGTRNTVTGANTYVLGTGNSTAGSIGTVPSGKDISAVDSGVFGNRNAVAGEGNRVMGNENMVLRETATELQDIMVTGNSNVISGDTDTDTQLDANAMRGISVTGSHNQIYAKNRSEDEDLTDIAIIGNFNKVDTSDVSRNLSNTQILGSNVTATMGNSVYLGSSSAYVADGSSSKGMSSYNTNGTYRFAGGTPAGIVTVGNVGAERRIQNVAAGLVSASSTDAVNGSQLYALTLPLRFGGDNSTIGASSSADVNVIKRGSDQAMSVLGGASGNNLSDNNIGVVADSSANTLRVKLAKDIQGLNSVTSTTVNANTVNTETLQAGDTTVNSDGLTINNGPSITKTGIDAGGNKITNVAAGVDGTDAVNVSQLNQVINADQGGGFGLTAEDGNSVKKNLGETVSVVGSNQNITTSVVDGKLQIALSEHVEVESVTADTVIANTVNAGAVNANTVTATTVTADTVNADTVNTTTLQAGDTTVNSDGLTINNGPSITKTGIDAADNKVTNVADGDISATSKDAINGSQIHQIVEDIKQQHTAVTVNEGTVAQEGVYNESGNLQIKQDTAANGKVTYDIKLNDNLEIGGANGKDGSITINDKDGNTGVSVSASDGIGTIGLNGKDGITTIRTEKGEAGVDGQDGITRIIYQDPEGNEHQGATLDDGLKFGADSGTTALNKLNSTVNIVGEGTKADDDYSGANIKTFVTQDGNGDTSITVKMDKNLSNIDSIAINGKDGKDGSEGAIGLSGKDGISIKGKDGKDAVSIKGEDGIGTIGLNGKDGITTIRTEKGEAGVDGQDGITRIIYQDPEGNEHQGATLDDGMKYSGDSGEQLKMKLNENVNIVGGITDTNQLTDNNIGVVSDGRDTLTVKLNKDITGLNSVTAETVNATTVNTTTLQAGDTTVNDNGLTINNGPSITKSGVDAGGSKITNVAPGEISATSRDAVNGSQLYASNQRIENNTRNINKLDDRLSKVGAGAAALAALHPMDFDPDDKWNVAAGIGSYKDKQAAAIGAFYRPDENTMFSIGGTVGNGENMVNAGVTFALDRRSHVSRSRTAMAKDMLDMQKRMLEMQAQMDQMASIIGQFTGADVSSAMFPDVPENHWAYEYIEGLQKRGIIEGYPDGDFKGDRSMTRYEYAAMLYRALMQGEKLDARAAAEFAPELGRIRVDRIAGKDGDRNKIERVRVNDQPAKERDVYGSRMASAEAE